MITNFSEIPSIYFPQLGLTFIRWQVNFQIKLPYFPAHKTHRNFFIRNFRKIMMNVFYF